MKNIILILSIMTSTLGFSQLEVTTYDSDIVYTTEESAMLKTVIEKIKINNSRIEYKLYYTTFKESDVINFGSEEELDQFMSICKSEFSENRVEGRKFVTSNYVVTSVLHSSGYVILEFYSNKVIPSRRRMVEEDFMSISYK